MKQQVTNVRYSSVVGSLGWQASSPGLCCTRPLPCYSQSSKQQSSAMTARAVSTRQRLQPSRCESVFCDCVCHQRPANLRGLQHRTRVAFVHCCLNWVYIEVPFAPKTTENAWSGYADRPYVWVYAVAAMTTQVSAFMPAGGIKTDYWRLPRFAKCCARVSICSVAACNFSLMR